MGYTLSTLKSLRALLVGLSGVTLIQGSLSSCPIWKCSHKTLLILARRKCKLFYGSAHRVLLSSCTDLEYSSLTMGSILSGYVPNLLAPKTPSTDCLRLLTPVPDLNILTAPHQFRNMLSCLVTWTLKTICFIWMPFSVSDISDFQHCFALSCHSFSIPPLPILIP